MKQKIIETWKILLLTAIPNIIDVAGEASVKEGNNEIALVNFCLLYTSPSPRDQRGSRMPSSA